ncbi:EH signature domain-containing protein [Xanthobacter autotrophicus]|uniref:EH signature domain-containing protein n=1 Tax=Xanthobacter autotrophicus TaxID=280 RepID=UPI003729B725
MSLQRVLAAVSQVQSPALPGLNTLRAAVERVQARWPDVVADPPERDRERLVAEMMARLQDERWAGLTMQLATSAARATFDPIRRNRPDLVPLRTFYCAETRVSTSATFLAAMLSVYMDSYMPGAPHTHALSVALKEARLRMGARGTDLITRIPALLDPASAPEAIAALMVEMGDVWEGLKAIGLRTPHAPGLMDHAHLAYVRRLQPDLGRRADIDRLFAWLKPDQQLPRTSGAGEAITALLSPWLSGDPSKDDVAHITQTLVGFYGDPRVNPGGVWAGVPQTQRDVILRWLTGKDIRFFLDVVSQVEDSHMWEPRRTFWLGLYEQKRIDAAWVAFSRSGVELARRSLPRRDGVHTQSYGTQSAGGGRSNTSLLILKVGSKIVVEGSHSYKVHIFSAAHPAAPKLYQPTYDCEAIRLLPGSEARPHLSGWQGWVEERI